MFKMPDKSDSKRLSALLGTLSSAEFFATYYEKQPLFITRNDPGFYGDLLTTDAIDKYLEYNVDRVSTVNSLSDEGQRVGYAEGSRTAFVEQALGKLYDGYSIVLDALQHRHPPLRDLCMTLQAETFLRFQTNIYITPPKARAFKLHFDSHDVFVLQTYGSKKWFVDDTQLYMPAKHDHFSGEDTLEERTYTEHLMQQGDLLYLPRGYLHRAESNADDFSIHITLGIHPPTWHKLLGQIAESAARANPFLLETVPVHEIRDDNPDAVRAYARKIAEVIDEDLIARELMELPRQWQDELDGEFQGQFKSALSFLSAEQDKRYSANAGLIVQSYMDAEENQIVLRFYGKEVRFPDHVRAAVEYCMNTQNFASSDIPGLDAEESAILLERLVQEGLILAAGTTG